MDTVTIKIPSGDYYFIIGILGELANKGEMKNVDLKLRLKMGETIETLWKEGVFDES